MNKGIRVRIMVACNGRTAYHQDAVYRPIQGGAALAQERLDMDGDDTGDNISLKNPLYCENSRLYWAWKNLKGVDVIGLCHYRRYFDFHGQALKLLPYTKLPLSRMEETDFSVPESVLRRVSGGAVVLARPVNYSQSLKSEFCCSHYSEDFRRLERTVVETQPEAVKEAFYHLMYQEHRLSHFNMFLMNWTDFCDYCGWLFPLLEKMEPLVDTSHYNPYQSRLFGYYSERLLNVWTLARRKPVITRPVLWFGDGFEPQRGTGAGYWLRSRLNDIGNFFSRPHKDYRSSSSFRQA